MTAAMVCRDETCTGRHCLIGCGRHCDPTEATCVWCLGLSRRWLKAIPDLAAQISRDNDGWGSSSPGFADTGARGNAETPLPGGDRVALISPGGDGRNASGHEWNADHHPDDPPSVLAALESWERDWRETLHLPAAMTVATLTNVTGFLLANLDWAARRHPAFDDFWNELRQLHARLEHAVGASQRPVVGDVTCFACSGVRLARTWRHDGLDDQWHCPRCKRRYTIEEHHQAEKDASETYRARLVSVPEVAAELGITEPGVWMAVKRKNIRCLMTYENRKLFNPADFRKAGYPLPDRNRVTFVPNESA